MKRRILSLISIMAMTLPLVACGLSPIETSNSTYQSSMASSNISGFKPNNDKDDSAAKATDEKDYEVVYSYDLNKCYIVFHDPTPYRSIFNQRASMEFKSIEDFLDRLLNGTLTISDKAIVATTFEENEIGFEICNLRKLYYPKLPEGAEMMESFSFSEYGYGFGVVTDGQSGGYISVYNQKNVFDTSYERDYVNFEMPGAKKISKVIEGTDITGIHYYRGEQLRVVQYELRNEEKTVYVKKSYSSEGVVITLYCAEGDMYYKCWGILSEDKSNDWLLSFSLEPYSRNEK